MAIVAAVVSTACGRSAADTSVEAAIDVTQPQICEASPLAAYCARNPCPDYATAVEQTRRDAASSPSSACFDSIGICGDLRYTVIRDGYGGTYLFFGADGMMVAARGFSDVPFGPCGATGYVGAILTCTPQPLESFCPR